MTRAEKEILVNVERLNRYMDDAGLSAVVVRSGRNFNYLSGVTYRGTLARHIDAPDAAREMYLVWPREGEPVLITNMTGEGAATSESWVSEIEVCRDYSETGIVKMAQVIVDKGLAEAKIGMEKTYISAARFEEIGALLPDARIVDCTELMNSVRAVKTPGEVALLERAADILDEAYLEVYPSIEPGETEREVHARLIKSCLDGGAEFAHGSLVSSRNPDIYNGEGDTPFLEGDIIRPDYVAYYRGYPGHQNRLAVMGKPTDEQKHTYRRYRDAYMMSIGYCRPGIKASQVYEFARNKLIEYGFPHKPGAMIGHSVGTWFHQQKPLLVSTDETVIEAGMVIAIETYWSYWHLQDLVLIGEVENRILSDRFDTEELFVIG